MLPLLTGGPQDRSTRLRSMGAAISWSYDLLDPDEQALFSSSQSLPAADSRSMRGVGGTVRITPTALPSSTPSRP